MQKKINIALFSIIFVLLFYIIISNEKIKVYSKKINYLDNTIVINIYSKNSNLSNKALKEIEKIYKSSNDEICITTNKASKKLKQLKIKNYIINAQGNIIVGNHYNNNYYKVALEDPNIVDGVFKILKLENKSVATLINPNYEIKDNVRYFSDVTYKSINVISDDLIKSKKTLNKISQMNINEGKKYINNLKDVDAIWYLFDDSIITSKGIKNYE